MRGGHDLAASLPVWLTLPSLDPERINRVLRAPGPTIRPYRCARRRWRGKSVEPLARYGRRPIDMGAPMLSRGWCRESDDENNCSGQRNCCLAKHSCISSLSFAACRWPAAVTAATEITKTSQFFLPHIKLMLGAKGSSGASVNPLVFRKIHRNPTTCHPVWNKTSDIGIVLENHRMPCNRNRMLQRAVVPRPECLTTKNPAPECV